MAGRNRGTSPYDESYDDEYSDDFDDEPTEAGGKRYKTRSPLLRSGERRHNSRSSNNKRTSVISETGDPASVKGSKTYRKSKGDISPGSGYMTPDSPDPDKSEYCTPRSRVTADDALLDPKPGKKSSLRAASEYMSQCHSPRKHRSYRGRGRGRGRYTGRMSTESSQTGNVTKRVLSARRLRINELQNSNSENLHIIKDLKEEIRLLKKTQIRQDKALLKFEDRESDLPQLIQRQNNEVRSLRDQIRKWREKYEKTDRYLRDAEDDLEKVKIKLKKLKSLADEKDLPERGDLNKQLNKQELDLEAKDVKIKELERYIQNLEKNHRHELGIERARQKDIKKQLDSLQSENQKLSVSVEEKNKELQMKNIYANRMNKPPHRLPNSYNGTPHGTPPPRKRRPSLSGAEGMTPRERAKQMEQKRREELRKQREIKQKNKRSRNSSYVSDQSSPRRAILPRSPLPNGDSYSARHKPIIRTTRDSSSHSNFEQHEKLRREQELRKRREQEEREREERERYEEERELEEKEKELNEQARRDEEERALREERKMFKQQADERARSEREKKEREEKERREKKEREERERKERREREERERRERERLEQERRAQEERRRFDDDVTLHAEKKKKDEILQKLREIDEGVQKNRDRAKFNDPFFVTEAKEDSQDSMASSKKSYTFSKPIENLHKGKPSHKEAFNGRFSPSKPASRKDKDKDLDIFETGGYNPTFGSKPSGSKGLSLFDDDKPAKSNKTANKSKLMADLFGSSEPPKKQNDIFASSQPKKSNPSSTRPSFLWDDDTPSSNKNLGTKRENSATLFGGGSALVNDEDLHKSHQRSNASTVSRRQKQTTTAFHTRPTVNAIDQIEDDLEEVML